LRDFDKLGDANVKYVTETIVLAVGAFIALLGAAFAQDKLFGAHMWVLFFVLLASTLLMVRRISFAPAAPARSSQDDAGYFDEVVKYGVIATVFWGVVGFLVGVVVALQLAFPDLNIEPWLNFGRTRPLHPSTSGGAPGGPASSAAISAGSCSGATSSSSSWPPPAICSASRRAGNMPSRNGMSTCG